MDITVLCQWRSTRVFLICLYCMFSHCLTAWGAQLYYTTAAPALSRSNLAVHGGQMYEVRFNPAALSTDLVAQTMTADGSWQHDELNDDGTIRIFNGDWRAQLTLDSQSQRLEGGSVNRRTIITSGSNGIDLVGRRFNWNHIQNGLTYADGANEDLKSLLDPEATEAQKQDESLDHPLVSWVRGDDKFEGIKLSQRDHVLGNIIHSSPQYVGPPFETYDLPNNPGYSAFRRLLASRPSMVYIGGAMLHAFRASDGMEVFAYIPHAILGSLGKLAYNHPDPVFLVDGSPTIADAFGDFGSERCGQYGGEASCWLTVLVSGLGQGGNAIFALNVTNPEKDAETEAVAAAQVFLWEFKHDDLGRTTARPIIERLSDGTWVSIFGNGQQSGKAKLFVLSIGTGELIQELTVPSIGTDNGLSSPTAWDHDFDGDIDFVYAGDQEGNLWRFDFTDAGVSGGASISFSGAPLISVQDPVTSNPLPISISPLVSLDPGGGLLVFFGTGANIQNPNDHNAMFGVQDKGVPLGVNPPLLTRMVETQPLLATASNDAGIYRTIVVGDEENVTVGWKLSLPAGERILNEVVLNNGKISFTTVAPETGGPSQNWLMSLDYETGDAPGSPFLDLNGDGIFDDRDRGTEFISDNAGDSSVPIGLALGAGVVSAPVVVRTDGGSDTLVYTRNPEIAIAGWGNLGFTGGSFDLDPFSAEGGSLRKHTQRCDTSQRGPGNEADCMQSDGDQWTQTNSRSGETLNPAGESGDVPPGNVVREYPGSVQVTETIHVPQSVPLDGRVSWREILD